MFSCAVCGMHEFFVLHELWHASVEFPVVLSERTWLANICVHCLSLRVQITRLDAHCSGTRGALSSSKNLWKWTEQSNTNTLYPLATLRLKSIDCGRPWEAEEIISCTRARFPYMEIVSRSHKLLNGHMLSWTRKLQNDELNVHGPCYIASSAHVVEKVPERAVPCLLVAAWKTQKESIEAEIKHRENALSVVWRTVHEIIGSPMHDIPRYRTSTWTA